MDNKIGLTITLKEIRDLEREKARMLNIPYVGETPDTEIIKVQLDDKMDADKLIKLLNDNMGEKLNYKDKDYFIESINTGYGNLKYIFE